jgi:hypothetical protein
MHRRHRKAGSELLYAFNPIRLMDAMRGSREGGVKRQKIGQQGQDDHCRLRSMWRSEMKTHTVVIGLILAFLLFTDQGREAGAVMLFVATEKLGVPSFPALVERVSQLAADHKFISGFILLMIITRITGVVLSIFLGPFERLANFIRGRQLEARRAGTFAVEQELARSRP